MPELELDIYDPISRLRGLAPGGRRILVVEDDLDLMNIVERMALRLDPEIEIDWVTSVPDALDRLDRRQYKLVLADYYLRGSESGLALLAPCSDRQQDAVFAMMSSCPFEELWQRTTTREFPFLRKPFSAAECFGFLGATYG